MLQVAGELRDTFGWAPVVVQALTVILGIGFFAALVFAWYHGEKGQQRVSGVELLMLTCLLLLAGAGVASLQRSAVSAPPAGVEANAASPVRPTARADRASLVVLPFDNLSTSKDDEYFSDGVTDEILMTLADIRGLRVISRTSSMQYKQTTKPVRQIASELGVMHVLEGSVQRQGDRVRVRVQLVEAERDMRLWAQRYDRPIANIFTVQSEIAREIARALQQELTPQEELRLERMPTDVLTAYDLMLRAREHYYRFSQRDNEAAGQLLHRALELDPDYVDAQVALADVYRMKGQVFGGGPAWEDSAVARARLAIALDPGSARAHNALGWALDWQERLDAAREAYLRAIELNPDLTDGLANLSHHGYGRMDEAIRLYKRALAVNPTDPLLNFLTAWAYEALGMSRHAKAFYERTVELQPAFALGYNSLARLAVAGGRPEEAQAYARRMLDVVGQNPATLTDAGLIAATVGDLAKAEQYFEKMEAMAGAPTSGRTAAAWVYLQLDRPDRARAILRRAAASKRWRAREKKPETYIDLAVLRLLQGDRPEALRQLEIGVRKGWRDYYVARADPVLRELRGEPRFEQLMAEVKAEADRQRARVEQEEDEDVRMRVSPST